MSDDYTKEKTDSIIDTHKIMVELLKELSLVTNSFFEKEIDSINENEKFFIISRAINLFYVSWFENMGRQFDNKEYKVTFEKIKDTGNE